MLAVIFSLLYIIKTSYKSYTILRKMPYNIISYIVKLFDIIFVVLLFMFTRRKSVGTVWSLMRIPYTNSALLNF